MDAKYRVTRHIATKPSSSAHADPVESPEQGRKARSSGCRTVPWVRGSEADLLFILLARIRFAASARVAARLGLSARQMLNRGCPGPGPCRATAVHFAADTNAWHAPAGDTVTLGPLLHRTCPCLAELEKTP